MNFLVFSKEIKNIKRGSIRYYYIEYEGNNDDINKTFSFFIGAVSLTSPAGSEFECPTVRCLDASGKQCIKTYGYYTFINCDIRVFKQYNILGETQGDHIKTYIGSLIKGEVSLEPLKDNGTYVNVKLARTRLFKEFWDLNKDWLIKIKSY